MKELAINIADCSSETLIKAARKCGLVIMQGKKHCKIVTVNGVFVTTIPRHARLKRELVRGIVERYNQFGIRKVVIR